MVSAQDLKTIFQEWTMLNYPDPFIHPNAYWQLTHDDNRLTERQKRQMLKAVGMDYDKEPKKTKQEMELSA